MKCSLSKLFWTAPFTETKCFGACRIISSLSESVCYLLKNEKCSGKDDTTRTLGELVINRLTPFELKTESIGNLDVCKNHLVRKPDIFIAIVNIAVMPAMC